MCDQSTACNPYWHKCTGRAPQSGCFGLHLILYSINNTATDRRWERSQLSTPPAKKQAPLTTRSSSLRCVSAAEHHTAEQYSKIGKKKKTKASPNFKSIRVIHSKIVLKKISRIYMHAFEYPRHVDIAVQSFIFMTKRAIHIQ